MASDSRTVYNISDLNNKIKSEKIFSFKNIETREVIGLHFLVSDECKNLQFINCYFKEYIKFSGVIGNGIEFIGCTFSKEIGFEALKINIEKPKNDKSLGKLIPSPTVGLRSSILFSNCTINALIRIINSELERGVYLLDQCNIDSIEMENVLNIHNSLLNIRESTIITDLYVRKGFASTNIDIRKSDIKCHCRFESLNLYSIVFQDCTIEKFSIWGSTIHQSFTFDRVEIKKETTFTANIIKDSFCIYNSIFLKEFEVNNFDGTNNLIGHTGHYIIKSSNFDGGLNVNYNNQFRAPSLNVKFSLPLKGNMFFENISFKDVLLEGYNNTASLTFDNCKFFNFSCNNFTNNQILRISRCSAHILDGKSLFVVENSNVGKTNISGSDFFDFNEIRIKSSFIYEILTSNVRWFKDENLIQGNKEKKETYRQLKIAAERQGDIQSYLEFKRRELFYLMEYMDENKSYFCNPIRNYIRGLKNKNYLKFIYLVISYPVNLLLDLFVLFFNSLKLYFNNKAEFSNLLVLQISKFTNDFGNNWIKPIKLIIVITVFMLFQYSGEFVTVSGFWI